jgi:hypothetical protein
LKIILVGFAVAGPFALIGPVMRQQRINLGSAKKGRVFAEITVKN